MRDLIVTENITVDGVIDLSAGWFLPAGADGGGPDASDHEEAVREQREASDAFLVGRETFEQMRGYWAHRADDATGIGANLDAVPKYVVSRTLAEPGWENTTVLGGALTDEILALKERDGADIVTTGSIRLVHALVAAGLVDEFRLFVHPVVVRSGARLFEPADAPTASAVSSLRLVETRPFRSGVVLVRYRTAA